jgi:transcriptional regulator with XRE-family HTH domain
MLALSDNIRHYRQLAQITQSQLAETVGVDQSAICKLEKGMFVPTVVLVAEISLALGVSIDELVNGGGK